ncbi:PREDICTED: facilitated trehalose transporter Tret1-like [Papilio xuthus]|uniref:Facilitated trehalose transporter Tret1-like n=1 Tax=Papilio xuthus TaxID=66420 RepID=A0AAJ7E9W8_PAPXU|nr:PREDICTED: facilitated trehalose transporter Tret1-like [Papilio xuthus]
MSKNESKYMPFLRQCFVTASVALNIVGHGAVIGYAAVLIPALRSPDSPIVATPSQESWIASIIGFALIVGNFIITPLMDTLGRKKSHLLTILPNMTGWFMLLMVNNVAGLIIARFLQGIAMGMLGPLGSIIIGEMTDPKNRGAFLTSVSLSLTIGVLFSHALGTYFSWQQNALICSFITFISLILIIHAPESPSWLISKGRYEKGSEIFFWLRGKDDRQRMELEDLIAAQKSARKSSIGEEKQAIGERVKRLFNYLCKTSKKPEFYKPILIMFLLYTMFQFAGINVLSSYVMDIVHQLIGPDANAKVIMVALDVERLVCNLLAVFLMKTMKRRTLLFSTAGICVLSYLGKAGYLYCKQNDLLPYDNQWIPLFLIGIYMFSLTIGISSIPFAISGEIFPLEYRGLGGGISVWALSLNFFVAVKSFPVLIGTVGLPVTYCLYAGILVICLIVIYFLMPETKDRTLQDIENSFRGWTAEDYRNAEPLNGKVITEMRRCSSHILY